MIGAIYQCYKRMKCAEFVLTNYRLHYPDATVVLISDGGLDFSRVAQAHGCVYLHEDRLSGPLSADNERPIGMTGANYFHSPQIIKNYFDRLARCLSHIKQDYFMILEDDVFVLRATATQTLQFDVNGFNPHENLPPKVCAMLGRNHLPYGACGGSILSTKLLSEALSDQNRSKLHDLIDQFCACDPMRTKWAGDALISFVVYAFGGTIGGYPGFCETWHPDLADRLRKNTIEVLHLYKALYDLE